VLVLMPDIQFQSISMEGQMTRATSLYGACAVVAFVAFSTAILPAQAAVIPLKAELKGGNEVPPNSAKGSGMVTMTYDSASKRLTWEGNLSGLSGAPTAAHFHGPAKSGKNASVQLAIPNPAAKFQGSALLTDKQAAALLDGQIYVNIHTVAHPGGELRGQVVK
jgi:hypothetical protein